MTARAGLRGFSPEAAAALAAAIDRAPAGALLALDFDETCIEGDAGDAAFWGLALERLYALDRPEFWRALGRGPWAGQARLAAQQRDGDLLCRALIGRYDQLFVEQDPLSAYMLQTRITAGLTQRRLERRLMRCLARQAGRQPELIELSDGRRIRWGFRAQRPIRDLAHLAREHGMRVAVVSATLQPAVVAACRLLDFPVDLILGNRTYERDGRLTSRLVKPIVYGPGKPAALLGATGQRPWIAIGDSHFDLPLLQAAQALAVLYRPIDPALIERGRALGVLVEPR